MRYRLPAAVLVAAAGITVLIAAGRPSAPATGDEAAIRQAVADYAEAYNAADIDGVMAVWAADAEYVDETGEATRGRDGLAARFARSLRENGGARVTITTRSIRVLKQGVAVQDGVSVLTRPGAAQPAVIPFSAVWVKADGKWLVRLVHNLDVPSPGPEADPPHVRELAWLVGEWTATEKGSTTTLTARWMDSDKFLAVDYTVRQEGGRPLSVTHVIGLDPTNGWLRSSVFEKAAGGTGEGYWRREQNTWTVPMSGVTGDGKAGAATLVWSVIDDNTFTLEVLDRHVGGRELPDLQFTFHRSDWPTE